MNEEYEDVPPRNYWRGAQQDAAGLKYRLEGSDIMRRVIDTLKGGRYRGKDGRMRYNDKCRLMNDEGVSRVEMYLSGAVHKGAHLTKYKNEERIMTQMKSLANKYLLELTLNMKVWGVPDPQTGLPKVRNKHLVLQVVENAILQAMQRGLDGFEAQLTGKNINVQEQINPEGPSQGQRKGLLNRLFGRGGQQEGYYGG